VDENLPLVPAPAVDLEHAVERRVGPLEIILLNVDGRDEMREGGILPGSWDLGDDLVAEYLLVSRARRVDERSFVRHPDGLGHATDLHVRVHGRNEGPGQLDSLALDQGEPWQRKRHGIAAGPQVLNRVLARPVGND